MKCKEKYNTMNKKECKLFLSLFNYVHIIVKNKSILIQYFSF